MAKIEAPEAALHRSRKDRRRWCRGKQGVPHEPVIELATHWVSMRYHRQDGSPRCRWEVDYWVKSERDIRWDCGHQERCRNCRRILDYRVDTAQCPEYREPPPPPYLCLTCGHELAEHPGRGRGCPCGCRWFRWKEPGLD